MSIIWYEVVSYQREYDVHEGLKCLSIAFSIVIVKMITFSIIINDDHFLDSQVCHSNDVLDGLIRRRKHVLESQIIINIRVHCAPGAPKAQPVKLPPATRGT